MLLSWQKTKELLEKYQIPMVESLVIENLEQGIEFANKIGYPVVLKVLSDKDLHKTEKGFVRLNITNETELRENLNKFNFIQKQVYGAELFIGVKRDKSFGPIISFGLGGIFVEVLKDIVFAICPLSKKEAIKMIKEIKGYKVLTGYRGSLAVSLDKLADLLVNVSKIGQENKNIQEIDFNPIIASGSDIFIVDPKIIIK